MENIGHIEIGYTLYKYISQGRTKCIHVSGQGKKFLSVSNRRNFPSVSNIHINVCVASPKHIVSPLHANSQQNKAKMKQTKA